jgi:hypothetical protein
LTSAASRNGQAPKRPSAAAGGASRFLSNPTGSLEYRTISKRKRIAEGADFLGKLARSTRIDMRAACLQIERSAVPVAGCPHYPISKHVFQSEPDNKRAFHAPLIHRFVRI